MRNIILAVLFLIICFCGYIVASVAHATMPEEPTITNISWKHELTAEERMDVRLLLATEDWKIEDHFFYKVAKGQRTKFIVLIGNEQWYLTDVRD